MNHLFSPMAHARPTDPNTSREAANEVSLRIRRPQLEVLEFPAELGLFTDLQMNEFFRTDSSTYRTRRAELVSLGSIEDRGERMTVRGTGRKHALWRINGQGRAEHLR